jgi:hypothetical protein
MAVGVERDPHGGMSKAFSHDLGVRPGGQPERRVGVANIVESHERDSSPTGEFVEATGDAVRAQWRPVLSTEHQVKIGVDLRPGDPLLVLSVAVTPQSSQVVGSTARFRRDFVVFGVENVTLPPTELRVWRMATRPALKSMSDQRKPRSSPRRRPVVASSSHAA